jgi:hypothetical protein
MGAVKAAVPLLAILLAILLATGASAGTIGMDLTGADAFPLGKKVTGTLNVLFSQLIPGTAVMNVYVDSIHKDTVSMDPYMENESFYQFGDVIFDYNMTAAGTNTWTSYPDQTFNYNIRAQGTCGGAKCCDYGQGYCWCTCPCGNLYNPSSFPCSWSATLPDTGTVNGGQGLKQVRVATITPPLDNNGDTVWAEIGNDNGNVITTMRAACGNSISGYITLADGWSIRVLLDSELLPISGTFDREINISKFDHSSLDYAYRKYGGPFGYPGGGVYKDADGAGPQQPQYQYPTNQVEWNGNTGYIRIKNYDQTATYVVVFLPPNGDRLCAYTNASQYNSQQWTKSKTQLNAVTKKGSPFTKQWSDAELSALLPPPPCPEGCTKTVNSYNSVLHRDTTGTVQVSYSPSTKTTSATTTSNELSRTYSASISMSDFTSLYAPETIGIHVLTFRILDQGSTLSEGSFNFTVCNDTDKDTYCGEVNDCDDNDAYVYPGAPERCNGKDDDCDGTIDEDFWSVESRIGNPCGVGACAGYYVCTPDGSDVVCSSDYREGELLEICDDNIDNDCDGVTDERYEMVGGQQVEACVCKNGETRPCGTDVGECVSGYQLCTNHIWSSECIDSVQPSTEVCNGKDDDCDGIIDNVGGGSSVQSTKCACYGGGQPSEETCNEIDDDCDGMADEDAACCATGSSRPCGTDIGICKPGTQRCIGGSWGPCEGGVGPTREICYNDLDDNCDGLVDEDCTPDLTCSNDVQDINEDGVDCGGICPKACPEIGIPTVWLIFSAVILVVVLGVGILAFKGMI